MGNSKAFTLLQKMFEKGAVPSTLLFAGPKGSGKKACADIFATKKLGETHQIKIEKGIHPDYQILSPEGKTGLYTIEDIRSFIHEVSQSPYEAKNRVFVIEDADKMLPSSSNALLKTLEEPKPFSTIILLTSDPDSLLPTIISRCCRIDFHALAKHKDYPYLTTALENKDHYPTFLQALQDLEKEIEELPTPAEKKIAIDEIFEQILSSLIKTNLETSIPPYHVDEILEKGRLAFFRNVKVATLLEYVLSGLKEYL